MPTGKRFTELPHTYKPGDKVRTAGGCTGTVLQETVNTYLLRTGRVFDVRLDTGETITANEHELERISAL